MLKKLHFLNMALLILLLAACDLSDKPFVPTSEETVSPTVTPALITPISTLTKTPTPSPTKISTLLPDDKTNLVNNMLDTNGGCELPCWWGYTAGEALWNDIEPFFKKITTVILPFTTRNPEITQYHVEIPLEDTVLQYDFFVRNDTKALDIMVVNQRHTIQEFLTLYGLPDEIWFNSDGEVPGSSFARIILFYPKQGMLAVFWGKSKLVQIDSQTHLVTCINQFDDVRSLWLWPNDSRRNLDELLSATEKLPDIKFKRLGEISNYDEQGFYASFLKNAKGTCIDTLAEIWPDPDLVLLTNTPTP